IGWLDLVASPVFANPTKTKERATEKDNRLRQLKAALRTLEKCGLIALKGKEFRNGRFEGFQLQHESGAPGFTGSPQYKIPFPSGDMIRLPVAFFLQGWIHTLSPAEVATYLMFHHLARRYPREHQEAGVYISGFNR
ncbi:hypothetical protein K7G98_36035, partial [Saccharothrix sp. MB29]|nr:hypothetical protein [Saccharothrix sp. MB29]